MAFYSCVKVFSPVAGPAPVSETVSGINDGLTNTPFEVRTIIKIGGYCAANTLTYNGLIDNSSYHWDIGWQQEGNSGSEGGGICPDFGLKIASGADGYGYTFMDTQPGIFFGGQIAGYGYVDNITAGSFRLNWVLRQRTGDAVMILCLGGDDYDLEVVGSPPNGTYTFGSQPQGFIRLVAQMFAANGAGPALTGAGGTSFQFGWADRDGVYGLTDQNSGSQAGNGRIMYDDRFSSEGATISWGTNAYTVGGAFPAASTLFNFCGADVVVKAGAISAPATDGEFSWDLGLNAKFVFFQSTGQDSVGVGEFTQGSICLGFVDQGLSQASYWTAERTVGNNPLLGARWLSDVFAMQTGYPDSGSSILSNQMTVTGLSSDGTITTDFAVTDGTTPLVQWFAVGTVLVPPTPPPTPVYRTREVVRRRLRRAPIVWAEKDGLQTRVKVNLFAVDMQPGVGTGDTPEPLVMVRASKDGGRTWGNERRVQVGRVGEYFKRLNTWQWGSGRQWVFEVSTSDLVIFNLVNAYIDAEPGES